MTQLGQRQSRIDWQLTQTRDCRVCGGEGWLPSLPEGKSMCPHCKGTGKEKK